MDTFKAIALAVIATIILYNILSHGSTSLGLEKGGLDFITGETKALEGR